MRFDPAKGLELDLLGPPVTPDDFIEQTETTTAPRDGWAPPRKRPRRVYKKLAARGFRARCDGPVSFTGEQVRVVKRTAPELAAWMDQGTHFDPHIRVAFRPLMYDGKTPRHVIPGMERYDRFMTEEHPKLSIRPYDPGEEPAVYIRRTTTWTRREIRCGVNWRDVGERQFMGEVMVYTPPHVEDIPRHALGMERHMEQLLRAILSAARGLVGRRAIAKQTSHRRPK
jgi:hypothetical protein